MQVDATNIKIEESIQQNCKLANALALESASLVSHTTAPCMMPLLELMGCVVQPRGIKSGSQSINPMFMNQHPWKTTDIERISAAGKLDGEAVA